MLLIFVYNCILSDKLHNKNANLYYLLFTITLNTIFLLIIIIRH